MRGLVEKLFWKSPFKLEAERLDVWNETFVAREDLVQSYSQNLTKLVRQVEMAEGLAERFRQIAQSGRKAPGTEGDTEKEAMEIARSMLPSLDALDRIIEYGDKSAKKEDEEFQNWLTSVKALRSRLMKTMEGIGLTGISSVGTEVDLNIHDVLAVVPASGQFPSNTVVEERQRAYFFRGKLLRDARVVVAQ